MTNCFSKIEAGCSLFETNEYCLDHNLAQMHVLIARYLEPWNETLGLSESQLIVADALELDPTHELIQLVLENPCQTITYGDLFKEGSNDVVACRVFRIQNADVLKAAISALRIESIDDDQTGFWTAEFECFDEHDHLFAANGHFYVSDSNAQRPLLLWDGEQFLLTRQQEVTGYVEEETISYDLGEFEVGGFDLYQSLKERLDLLNYTNQKIWDHQINAEWFRQQPMYVVENTLLYLSEVLFELIQTVKKPYLKKQ
jgi:hypothetical protein